MGRVFRENPNPLDRAQSNSTCPFYRQVPTGEKHVCMSRWNDLIAISPRYVDDYCLSPQHATCSLFLHADEEAKLYVSRSRERHGTVRVAAGQAPSDAAASHPEAKPEDAEVMQVEAVRGREAPDAEYETTGVDLAQASDDDQRNVGEGAERSHSESLAERVKPPFQKAREGTGRADEVLEARMPTDGELLADSVHSSPPAKSMAVPDIVEPVPVELEEAERGISNEQGAVSTVAPQSMRVPGDGRSEPALPVDVASVPAESTSTREISPESVPTAPAERQPILVESVPANAISADIAEPPVTPVEPLIVVQKHTAQTKDSVADSVDRQSNNDPSITEVDMPDTPQATDEVPGALPPSPVIVAPADGSVMTSRSIIFVGMAEPNCTVRLNDWTVPVGEGHADAEGRWNITVSGVPDETHLYTAQAIRSDGDVSPASRACTVTVQAERRPTSSAADPEADAWTEATVPAAARRRRTIAGYLALLLVLAAITTVEFWAQGSSHHRPALTATRRAAPAGAVPAPATTWHFPAVSGPAQQVLMTLSNRNPSILTVQVNSHGTLVQRLQIPPKNGAEIELPPKVARMPLTIRATGPIVPQRLVVNGSRVHPSYGSRSL